MSELPVILFRSGDVFTDVDQEALLPRLRLDPASSPVDVTDGILVEVDGQELADGGLIFEPSIYGEGPWEEFVASIDNGGLIGASVLRRGEWITLQYPEVTERLFYAGSNPDLNQVVHTVLPVIGEYWEPTEDDDVQFESPHLDPNRPADRLLCLSLSGLSKAVTLNAVSVRNEVT